MKKLLFASACVAAVATFGEELFPDNHTGFEALGAGTTFVGEKNDNGQDIATAQSGFLFVYEGAEGSTDGSIVKAYGVDDNLPVFDYRKLLPNWFENNKTEKQANYLELSTEGGTLWRSVTEIDKTGDPWTLGEGVPLMMLPEQTSVYVDTMVQFTPTEDGGTPQVSTEEGKKDKLAIWLDVQQQGEGETATATTNLCVLANGIVDDTGTPTTEPTKFVFDKAGIQPGVWYRLTVKVIPDLSMGVGFPTPAFVIYLDGVLLKTGTPAVNADFIANVGLEGTDIAKANAQGGLFASLDLESATPTFQGVGFKGSGAIDDLVITAEDPNFFSSAGSIDFTLTWGANVSAVVYTISGWAGAPIAAVNGEPIQIPAGSTIRVEATPADWFQITGGTGTFAPTEATTKEVTAALVATPADAGATTLPLVRTIDAKKWADAQGITPAQIGATPWAYSAYLMNSNLDAEPQLKITSIEQIEGGWNITVKATAGETTIDLANILGELQVRVAEKLVDLQEAAPKKYDLNVSEGIATIKILGDNTNFMRATVGPKSSFALDAE